MRTHNKKCLDNCIKALLGRCDTQTCISERKKGYSPYFRIL